MNRPLLSFANAFGRLRRRSTLRAPREIALRSNDHWKLPSRAGESSIRCLRGAVWITSEGQREDVVLTAGHEWQPASGGLTVVGALSDALLRVGAA
jgi:hypothetical protein